MTKKLKKPSKAKSKAGVLTLAEFRRFLDLLMQDRANFFAKLKSKP